MSAIVTSKLRLENANRLHKSVINNREFYYFFIAKPTDWSDENSPDTPIDSLEVTSSVFNELLTLKRVLGTDIQVGIKRYNWAANTYYQAYDDDIDIHDYNSDVFRPYYAITSDLRVYKCLGNNSVRETFTPNKITFDGSNAAVVILASNKITSAAHPFLNGNKVRYSATSGTAITGLTSGNSYYIVNRGANDFELSLTSGGDAIDLSILGTGTSHTLLQESFTLTSFTYTTDSGELNVYKNNTRLAASEYTESSSTVVTLDTGVVDETDTVVFEKVGVSTVKPTSTATDTTAHLTALADGYRWKYMFSVSSPNANKFLTTNWIPVEDIKEDDSSAQWDIQEAAVDGIDSVKVLNTGSGYGTRKHSGTAQGGSTSTTIVLQNTASVTDDYYNGMSVYITAGTGIGQLRVITDYVGSTKTATVAAWDVTPDITSTYEVTTTLTVTSSSGSGLTVRVPYAALGTNGEIHYVTVVTIGTGYKDATIVASSTPAVGSGASFDSIIPPYNGHGYYAQEELGANSLIFTAELDGTESGAIIAYNEFRKTGLIKNPLILSGPVTGATGVNATQIILGATGSTGPSATNDEYNGQLLKITAGPGRNQTKLITDYVGSTKTATVEYARTDVTFEDVWESNPTSASVYGLVADGSIYNQTLELTYSGAISGTFVDDEVITQQDSGAQGNIVYVDTGNSKIYLINIKGTFVTNKTISGDTASVLISAVGKQPIINFEGEVVLVEHRKKVTRSSDQKEDFKLIMEF